MTENGTHPQVKCAPLTGWSSKARATGDLRREGHGTTPEMHAGTNTLLTLHCTLHLHHTTYTALHTIPQYTTIHYTAHYTYTILHCTLHHNTLHTTPQYTTLHCTTPPTPHHHTALHCKTTPHYTCTTLTYKTPHYTASHCATLQYTTPR